MSDTRISPADTASLAALSSHYVAVAAAAKAAHLANDLFRIGTDRVVTSNTVAFGSLAAFSSHYTAVAAAAKSAHLANDLFRVGTDRVVISNGQAVTSLSALASGYAAVAAAAAATTKAIEAGKATFAAPRGARGTSGSSGASSDDWLTIVLMLGFGAAGLALGSPGTPVVSFLMAGLGAELGRRSAPLLRAVFDDIAGNWDNPLPADIQKRSDDALTGTGYSPFSGGMIDSNRGGGADIHIDLILDKQKVGETLVTREFLDAEHARALARMRTTGRR